MYRDAIDSPRIDKVLNELEGLYHKAKFAHDTNNLKGFKKVCVELFGKLNVLYDCYGDPFNELAKSITHKNPLVLDSYLAQEFKRQLNSKAK